MPPPPAKRTGAGIAGVVVAVLACAALTIALINLVHVQEIATEDATLPETLPQWVRAIMFNASLHRARMFGAGSSLLALLGVVLGLVGRRSVVGKVALGIAALGLTGSALAQVGAARHSYMDENRRSERPTSESAPPPASSAATDDEPPAASHGTKHAAFRLGNSLALAALGHANGANEAVIARIQAKANARAAELGAVLPGLPPLSGTRASDSADAIHYLLSTAGKPVWRHLETKYDAQHGALFELAIKLELLRMLHNDPEMQSGLVASIKRLGQKAGVASAVTGLALGADASSEEVGRTIDAIGTLVTTELARVKPPEPPPVAKPKTPSKPPPRAKSLPTTGVSDDDMFVITVH
jgi:hypothetical protein